VEAMGFGVSVLVVAVLCCIVEGSKLRKAQTAAATLAVGHLHACVHVLHMQPSLILTFKSESRACEATLKVSRAVAEAKEHASPPSISLAH